MKELLSNSYVSFVVCFFHRVPTVH
jgi:hypothetical protein